MAMYPEVLKFLVIVKKWNKNSKSSLKGESGWQWNREGCNEVICW
jgi:hypothetical protein